MRMNRRSLLASLLLPMTVSRLPGHAWLARADAPAAEPSWRHGIAHFSDLKYPAGFKQFDYVNAAAPKAGSARQIAIGSFDNFNILVNGFKGRIVFGIELLYDTLMISSLDEVSSKYGLLAEAISYPDDFSAASFRLNAKAKWHDGKPVTPDDVIFSFNALTSTDPQMGAKYRQVVKVEKTAEREVTFTFDAPGNRKLPQAVGELIVLPKHWWEEAGPDGNNKRNPSDTSLELPLGSGPYRIKEFSPGRRIVYERVPGYWAKDLNVNVGRNNLDEFSFEYFRDPAVAVEGFKTNAVDWRTENSAQYWATAYNFPAVTEGRVILEEFPINNIGGMRGFAFNTRRERFKDPRIRLAFNYVFNFEEMNKQLFHGQYKRTSSYFEGTELASSGLPTGRELSLLEPLRDKVPAELFTEPFTNPVNGDTNRVRDNLRQAFRLFTEAGYKVNGQRLVNTTTGEPFTVEFLSDGPFAERAFMFYKQPLERLGVEVSIRTVDGAQYAARMRDFDFDVASYGWSTSLLPGSEMRGYWGSWASAQVGSENVVGIRDPAVDVLIDQTIMAKNYDDLVACARALDRVLLWGHYVVPQWSYNKMRTARWNKFSYQHPLPKYALSAFPTLWWWDEAKAAKTR